MVEPTVGFSRKRKDSKYGSIGYNPKATYC